LTLTLIFNFNFCTVPLQRLRDSVTLISTFVLLGRAKLGYKTTYRLITLNRKS